MISIIVELSQSNTSVRIHASTVLPDCQCHDGYDWKSFGQVCDTHCMETTVAYCHPGSGDSNEPCQRFGCSGAQIRCKKPQEGVFSFDDADAASAIERVACRLNSSSSSSFKLTFPAEKNRQGFAVQSQEHLPGLGSGKGGSMPPGS